MLLEIKQRQELKLSQQLVMTPQLQMAIKFLQFSRLDLVEYVNGQLQQNPILEDVSVTDTGAAIDRTGEKGETNSEKKNGLDAKLERLEGDNNDSAFYDYFSDDSPKEPNFSLQKQDTTPSLVDNTLTMKTTLTDHLLWQLHLSKLSPKAIEIGEFIIGNLNEYGYLKDITISEIAKDFNKKEAAVEGVLSEIQKFDPWGVGARDLKECLLIQTKFLTPHTSIVEDIIKGYLPYLETKDYSGIAENLGVSDETVAEAVKIILELDPKPGMAYTIPDVQYVIPDVFIEKLGGNYTVTLNDNGMPKLKISRHYRTMLKRKKGDLSKNTRDYIQQRLQSAFWLIKSIHQRQKTLLKIARSIVKFQRESLDRGLDFLQPLVLKDVADDIGVHESTVSRVTTNKYASTPQGVIELKRFFRHGMQMKNGNGVAYDTIKEHIQRIVSAEDPHTPFSDNTIVKMLKNANIDIARRTVAKHRERIGIPPSSKRKIPQKSTDND